MALTVDFIKQMLEDIIEDDNVSVRDKLRAIKLAGEHLKMFDSGKKSFQDIRALFVQLNDTQLKGLVNGPSKRTRKKPALELEVGADGSFASPQHGNDPS